MKTRVYIALRFVAALGLLLCSTTGVTAEPSGDFVPEELVCRMIPDATVDSVNANYGTEIKRYLSYTGSYLLQTQPGQNAESLATIISARPDVYYCHANYLLDAPEAVQSSQPFLDAVATIDPITQPAATTLQLAETRTVATGDSVTVGIIDVGINLTHPSLASRVTSAIDYVDGDTIASDEPGGSGSGHGTFIAGVVNLVAPDAALMAYRVLDTNGRGDGFTIAEAVVQAVDDGCKVINLSVVMSGDHGALDDAVSYAHYNNVMVIAAAGNDSSEVERFPASDSNVLAVASLDSNDVKSSFSNYNGKVDISAPGEQVYAPFLDTSWAWWHGTSFAAPFVAGTAALIYQANPQASWDQVRDAIRETAVDVDSLNPLFAGKLGKGRINPGAAIQYASLHCCLGTTGNVDGAGAVDLIDLAHLIAYLLSSSRPELPCPDEANINGIEIIDLSDLSLLVSYLTTPDGFLPACR